MWFRIQISLIKNESNFEKNAFLLITDNRIVKKKLYNNYMLFRKENFKNWPGLTLKKDWGKYYICIYYPTTINNSICDMKGIIG